MDCQLDCYLYFEFKIHSNHEQLRFGSRIHTDDVKDRGELCLNEQAS